MDEYTLQRSVKRQMGYSEESTTVRFVDCIVRSVFAARYDKWYIYDVYIFLELFLELCASLIV